MAIIRERVDELRKKRGIQSLEDLLGHVQRYQPSLAWSSLSQIINDRRSPRLDNIEAIARALDTTIAYLIGETDDSALHPGAARISDHSVVYQIDTGSQEQRLLAIWRTLSPEDREIVFGLAHRLTGNIPPRIIGEEGQG